MYGLRSEPCQPNIESGNGPNIVRFNSRRMARTNIGPTHSQEETRREEKRREMMQHKVVNLNDAKNISLEHVLVESLKKHDSLKFELIDGGVFYLTQSEVWTAFNVLASDEFDILTTHINIREDKWKEAHDAYNLMIDDECYDMQALYEYGECMKTYGRYSALVDSMCGRIMELVGYDAWVDACRMYESLTGIPREWLS